MERLRTLVVTLSPLLGDLVTSVLQMQMSIDVVEVLASRESVADRLCDLAPDLAIIGLLEGENDSIAVPLLTMLPSARILVLARNAEQAWLHQSDGRRMVLSDLSAQSLRAALQSPGLPPAD